MGSPRFSLDKSDAIKILKGGVVAACGGLVAYLTTTVIPTFDNSTMTGMILATAGSVAVNMLRKFIADNS